MIGIMTFFRAVNYGAILQVYALQEFLNDLGINNEIIDYRCDYIEKIYSPMPNVSIKHIKTFLKQVKQIPIKYKSRRVFDSFIENNITKTNPLTKEMLQSFCRKYYGVITGSDQVWNLSLSGGDLSFALDFLSETNVKKLSYSASLGPSIIEQSSIVKLKPCLQEFDFLSVREETGLQQVYEMTGQKPVIDADPTVLLDIEKWNELSNRSKLKYKKFIFLYIMQPSDVLTEVAKELAKKNNYEIYSICMVENDLKLGHNLKGSSVEDFLWLIKNSEYVVTNSFHGIMLSIRFHKDFYWSLQVGKNMSNPRFDMLDKLYGINKRRCDKYNLHKNCEKLNWKCIEHVLENQKVIAKKHFHEMLNV